MHEWFSLTEVVHQLTHNSKQLRWKLVQKEGQSHWKVPHLIDKAGFEGFSVISPSMCSIYWALSERCSDPELESFISTSNSKSTSRWSRSDFRDTHSHITLTVKKLSRKLPQELLRSSYKSRNFGSTSLPEIIPEFWQHFIAWGHLRIQNFGSTSLPEAISEFWQHFIAWGHLRILKRGVLNEKDKVMAAAAALMSQLLWGERTDSGNEVAAVKAEISLSTSVRLPLNELPTHWTYKTRHSKWAENQGQIWGSVVTPAAQRDLVYQ